MYPRVASFRTLDALRHRLGELRVDLPLDAGVEPAPDGPLARPLEVAGVRVGNRFSVLPMEGWDGTADGRPSELTRRRWKNFGRSGAKLIWGGEAVAVRHDGRANPNQLLIDGRTVGNLAGLRDALVTAHNERFGRTDDLLIGLQLTHSGRYSRPNEKTRPEPLAASRHPVLDRRFPAGVPIRCLSDQELDRLVDDFVAAAVLAREAGFQFVDIKHCHGYLGHELLGAVDRPGRYGGSFENRTRFLRDVVAGVRASAPGLEPAVRVSAFDTVPYTRGPDGAGLPEVDEQTCRAGFGLLDGGPPERALDDARAFLRLLQGIGVRLVCITAGSPYYSPHIQRPALFPPSDGYLPPEDPLAGVARQICVTAALKRDFPSLVVVGSAYSYLQEWVGHVAQAVVRNGLADFVGLGRMMLAYPDLPADLLAGRPLRRASICRTFSDCTSGPRAGLVSGCFPLDPFYADHPDAEKLKAAKAAVKAGASPWPADRSAGLERDL